MYREEKWIDSQLWIKNTPDGEWRRGSLEEAVEAVRARGSTLETRASSRTVAVMLDKLAGYAIEALEAQLDVLKVPPELRWPVWENAARYAAAKAEECK